jgi:hypothetical protein
MNLSMVPKKPVTSMPPLRAPEHIRSTASLREFQRVMMQVVTRPLGAGNRTKRRWSDGRPTKEVVDTFSKQNDRLSGLERIEIYNRMYWFRTLDSLYEDLPGVRAVLGERKFMRLMEAYLVKMPSRSFTLRDLPSRLEKFIRSNAKLTAPHTVLAADMAAFEWAQIECYDGAARAPMTPADLADMPPSRWRRQLQANVLPRQFDGPSRSGPTSQCTGTKELFITKTWSSLPIACCRRCGKERRCRKRSRRPDLG